MIKDHSGIARFSKIKNPFSNQLESYLEDLWQEGWRGISNGWFLNDHNFYSDNFTKKHDGKHIVFSGCSVSFGVGLDHKDTWTRILFEHISKNEKTSGYFNLSQIGQSVFEIVFNLFKYFNEYGNPDYLFVNLPDPERFFDWDYKEKSFYRALTHSDENSKDKEKAAAIHIYSFQYLMMLNYYCESNNIKLHLFSYVDTYKDLKFNLPNFYNLDDALSSIYKYKNEGMSEDLLIWSRDNHHSGTGFHRYWAEEMINVYNKEMEELCRQNKT